MVVAKIAVAALLIISFPIAAFCAAIFLDRILRKTRQFGRHHYIPQKIDFWTEVAALQFAKPRVFVGEVILVCVSASLFYVYVDEADVFSATMILTLLSVLPLGALAMLLCGNKFFGEILGCQFCVWLRWVVLIIVIWCAHAQTATVLAGIFGPGSSHLTLAYSAGTFLSALGVMSLPTWGLLLLSQMSLMIVMGVFSVRHAKRSTVITGILAVGANAAIIIGLSMSGGAQMAIGLSYSSKLIVARLAYDYDMVDERVCTGVETGRKIVFAGSNQARAFVFSDQLGKIGKTNRKQDSKPFRLLGRKEVDARLPIFEGITDCKYRAVEQMSG